MNQKGFDDSYFENRQKNDPRRLKSFEYEKRYMGKYLNFTGTILDIGCSTGEFLDSIGWKGEKFGLEVNESARRHAIRSGIKFDKQLLGNENYIFDCIVLRGTVQHLDQPFVYLREAIKMLRLGGHIFLLATPNCESYIFKKTGRLPALDRERVYLYPQPSCLTNFFYNHSCRVLSIDFPYLDSGYAEPLSDVISFVRMLLQKNPSPSFAWPGNMFNMCVEKV
jgi:SAM-dependent methyltransferase